MPAPVLVAADGEDGPLGTPGQQGVDGLGGDPRLVAEHQHQDLRALVDGAQGSGDRGRAALAEVGVLDRLGARQVHPAAHLAGAAAQGDDQLVEAAVAGGRERVVEQRPGPVREQLLGLARGGASRRPRARGPVTKASADPSADRGTVRSLGGEAVAAALGAEVEALAVALELDARRAQRDLHAADRVNGDLDRGGGRRAPRGVAVRRGGGLERPRRARARPAAGAARRRRRAAAPRPPRGSRARSPRGSRPRSRGRPACAAGRAARPSRSSDCFDGVAALLAGDQADVGDLVAKGGGEDPLLVVPVGGDQDRGVVGAGLGALGRAPARPRSRAAAPGRRAPGRSGWCRPRAGSRRAGAASGRSPAPRR